MWSKAQQINKDKGAVIIMGELFCERKRSMGAARPAGFLLGVRHQEASGRTGRALLGELAGRQRVPATPPIRR